MSNCVECHDPPGGEACCPDHLTPMCVIKKGKPRTHCISVSRRISTDPERFRTFIVRAIIKRIGAQYRKEVNQSFTVTEGFGEFVSQDGAIKVSVQNITTGMLGLSG